MTSGPERLASHHTIHRGAVLALLPIGATFGYYGLPHAFREQLLIQFAPQLLAYASLGLWAAHISQVRDELGLNHALLGPGLRWGVMTGLVLGGLNTVVILVIYPFFGYDITFLKQTPHGRLPAIVVIPWLICVIALFVEVNFRGFILGRLAELETYRRGSNTRQHVAPFALMISTLTFAFDPFMVNTFQSLHWIALWDGLIWGTIWLRTRNLWITIVAHAVEVLVMYSAVKAAIG